eukprot:TRINITY_DN7660_c0_g1_i1.p2 TRINITY_DN7660_c0_g1~~TRINITY_DN7660_c0_g1_i1.p2  ORF type:complete len:113 (-),score=32.45 TRINITY_DN7660_c0_g1_i1:122-460(-)
MLKQYLPSRLHSALQLNVFPRLEDGTTIRLEYQIRSDQQAKKEETRQWKAEFHVENGEMSKTEIEAVIEACRLLRNRVKILDRMSDREKELKRKREIEAQLQGLGVKVYCKL